MSDDRRLALARELLLGIRHEKAARAARFGRHAIAASIVLLLLFPWLYWRTDRSSRAALEEARREAERGLERHRQMHEAELEVERAADFVFHGEDPAGHSRRLAQAVRRLRELRPDSPAIARALCLRPGAGQDAALFREAMAAARGTPDGAALAWDHSVFRGIAEAAWGEPRPAPPASAGLPRRLEADRALLAGENDRGLDLYRDLQRERRGDPTAWLGGALAALRSGSFEEGLRAAEEAEHLLDVPEGLACARALQGLCLERLGRLDEARSCFQEAARAAPSNRHARALAQRSPKPPPAPTPPPPDALVFRPPPGTDRSALDAARTLVRARFEQARLLPAMELNWEPDAPRLVVRTGGADGAAAQRAEWLVLRRGVLSARRLAPRDMNDRWTHPAKPEGHEWAPINVSYPEAPRAPGRHRLLLSAGAPAIAREHFRAAYDAASGRVTWACAEPERLVPGTWLALLLDGEIFWYGTTDAARAGSLTVREGAPQTLIPVLLAHGPLPVQFTRER